MMKGELSGKDNETERGNADTSLCNESEAHEQIGNMAIASGLKKKRFAR
jgi:hypothetical protein